MARKRTNRIAEKKFLICVRGGNLSGSEGALSDIIPQVGTHSLPVVFSHLHGAHSLPVVFLPLEKLDEILEFGGKFRIEAQVLAGFGVIE